MHKRYFLWSITVLTCLTLGGCGTTAARKRELTKVAKDWCLVIRASQIIPIYPLTEDLLPGDVFLVQTRVEDQVKLYSDRGFLPLDQHLARLQPNNYTNFYLGSHDIGTSTNTPYHWRFPANTGQKNDQTNAPRAAFPTYTFTVKRGGAANVALPVQGVPVALNVMGAGSAKGSVTIADAYTFGVEMPSIHAQVEAWAKTNQALLTTLGASQNTNYLRVVNRVYLTGKVNISMMNDSAFGVGASGGAEKPVTVLNTLTNNAEGNYTNTLNALNTSLASANIPGGTLKFASASSRSVSLIETFPRPLVVGYLGFDLPVLKGGVLGSPIPTQALVEGKKVAVAANTYGPDDNSPKIEAWLKLHADNRPRLRAWLKTEGFGEDAGLTNILIGKEFALLRKLIVAHFQIP